LILKKFIFLKIEENIRIYTELKLHQHNLSILSQSRYVATRKVTEHSEYLFLIKYTDILYRYHVFTPTASTPTCACDRENTIEYATMCSAHTNVPIRSHMICLILTPYKMTDWKPYDYYSWTVLVYQRFFTYCQLIINLIHF